MSQRRQRLLCDFDRLPGLPAVEWNLLQTQSVPAALVPAAKGLARAVAGTAPLLMPTSTCNENGVWMASVIGDTAKLHVLTSVL